jgi:glycosyltransferase involved in cell wall biosynthesis
MRILIIMDPGILVPPKTYGGHERLVEMFAKEYTRLGHEVHLLVTTGSEVPGCKVHPIGEEGFPPTTRQARLAIPTAWKFLWKHRKHFDLVHNFGRLAYLLPILHVSVKKIMTYGREINSTNISIVNCLPNKNLVFTGCSSNLISRGGVAGRWETVYNAIDFSKYGVQTAIPDAAPLMFLGRIEQVKGCHTAIDVAKETGHQLIIAGNVSPLSKEIEYFEKQIKPHIDGKHIVHVGAVNDEQKNEYLGKAKALLFPIEWDEPFGMVMTEAMACGTPVIGFRKGSVPEVIEEGVTGFVIDTKQQMLEAVKKVSSIDRTRCRNVAFNSFDVSVIALHYLSLFEKPTKSVSVNQRKQASSLLHS